MSLRSHSDVTCDVISYHWQCKIGVKSEWRFHQKTNSYSMEGREPSFSLIGFLFVGVCNVFLVCLFVFLQVSRLCWFKWISTKTLTKASLVSIILSKTYNLKSISYFRTNFKTFLKKSPFSFKHSKIYKFLFLRASFVCLSCYT